MKVAMLSGNLIKSSVVIVGTVMLPVCNTLLISDAVAITLFVFVILESVLLCLAVIYIRQMIKKSQKSVSINNEEKTGFLFETAYEQHIGTRKTQQDSVFVDASNDNRVLGIVCDGMGGMSHGEAVSRLTVERFSEAFRNLTSYENIPDFFCKQAEILDKEIYNYPGASNGKGSAGTTLCAVVALKDIFYWVSIGDSRIYLLRDGRLDLLTHDQNYRMKLEEMVESGTITKEQAEIDPQQDALINYIGIGNLTMLEFNPSGSGLYHDDIILICSDGLTRSLTEDIIGRIMTQYSNNLTDAAHILTMTAFDSSYTSQDNTSIVLIKYN